MIERVTIGDVAAAARRFLAPGAYTLSALGPRVATGVDETDWALAPHAPSPSPANGMPAPEPVAAPRVRPRRVT